MFALMAWTSLIIYLGMREPLYLVRADTLFPCIRGFDADRPKEFRCGKTMSCLPVWRLLVAKLPIW